MSVQVERLREGEHDCLLNEAPWPLHNEESPMAVMRCTRERHRRRRADAAAH